MVYVKSKQISERGGQGNVKLAEFFFINADTSKFSKNSIFITTKKINILTLLLSSTNISNRSVKHHYAVNMSF